MPSIPDRRVHARFDDGREIVRYDRAGKWYVEFSSGRREQLALQEVVSLACSPEAQVLLGVLGGSRFDRAVSNNLND